jgi:hypothetical protein
MHGEIAGGKIFSLSPNLLKWDFQCSIKKHFVSLHYGIIFLEELGKKTRPNG